MDGRIRAHMDVPVACPDERYPEHRLEAAIGARSGFTRSPPNDFPDLGFVKIGM